eukprot:UN11411
MEPKMRIMSFNEYCALHNVKSTAKKHAFQPLKCPSIPISFIADNPSISFCSDEESQKTVDMAALQRTYSGVDDHMHINRVPLRACITSIPSIPSLPSWALSMDDNK